MRNLLTGILLLGLSAAVFAGTTVPYIFAPTTTAKAAEVNADFQALATVIDSLSSRISRLEGTITAADMAGTYAAASLLVNSFAASSGPLDVPHVKWKIQHENDNGTFTLNPDATFVFSSTTDNSSLQTDYQISNTGSGNFVSSENTVNVTSPQSYSTGGGTWNLSGNKLTLAFTGGAAFLFTMAAGPSLFVSSQSTVDDHQLILLMRVK
jgi:hypothetical protein